MKNRLSHFEDKLGQLTDQELYWLVDFARWCDAPQGALSLRNQMIAQAIECMGWLHSVARTTDNCTVWRLSELGRTALFEWAKSKGITMATKQNSGSTGDGQKGPTKITGASNAGAGKVKGGGTIKGQTGAGGAKKQNSGSKGG